MWTRRAFLIIPAVTAIPALARKPMTKLRIQVTDLNDKPIYRAAVIVKFGSGRSIKKFGRKSKHQWEMKTNQEGIADMPKLPQGKIRVQVIAERYQTFGGFFKVLEEQKTIQIKLKPPQPQYSVQ